MRTAVKHSFLPDSTSGIAVPSESYTMSMLPSFLYAMPYTKGTPPDVVPLPVLPFPSVTVTGLVTESSFRSSGFCPLPLSLSSVVAIKPYSCAAALSGMSMSAAKRMPSFSPNLIEFVSSITGASPVSMRACTLDTHFPFM